MLSPLYDSPGVPSLYGTPHIRPATSQVHRAFYPPTISSTYPYPKISCHTLFHTTSTARHCRKTDSHVHLPHSCGRASNPSALDIHFASRYLHRYALPRNYFCSSATPSGSATTCIALPHSLCCTHRATSLYLCHRMNSFAPASSRVRTRYSFASRTVTCIAPLSQLHLHFRYSLGTLPRSDIAIPYLYCTHGATSPVIQSDELARTGIEPVRTRYSLPMPATISNACQKSHTPPVMQSDKLARVGIEPTRTRYSSPSAMSCGYSRTPSAQGSRYDGYALPFATWACSAGSARSRTRSLRQLRAPLRYGQDSAISALCIYRMAVAPLCGLRSHLTHPRWSISDSFTLVPSDLPNNDSRISLGLR